MTETTLTMSVFIYFFLTFLVQVFRCQIESGIMFIFYFFFIEKYVLKL